MSRRILSGQSGRRVVHRRSRHCDADAAIHRISINSHFVFLTLTCQWSVTTAVCRSRRPQRHLHVYSDQQWRWRHHQRPHDEGHPAGRHVVVSPLTPGGTTAHWACVVPTTTNTNDTATCTRATGPRPAPATHSHYRVSVALSASGTLTNRAKVFGGGDVKQTGRRRRPGRLRRARQTASVAAARELEQDGH